MSCALVGKTPLVVDWAIFADDDHVARRQVFSDAVALKLAGLLLKNEGPCGRELAYKIVIVEVKADRLPANRRRRLEAVDNLQVIGWPGKRGQSCVAMRDLNRPADDQWSLLDGLFLQSGLADRLD